MGSYVSKASSSGAGGGGSSLSPEQKIAYNQYMEQIGDSESRVKMVRVKSMFRDDGIFLTDEQLNTQIGKALATEDIDSTAIEASIDGIRFTSVPDSKGYADVEVSFKPITTYYYAGRQQLGGETKMERKVKNLPRKKLNIKIMNT